MPNHQKAANRKRAELAVAQFGARSDIDPTEAMLEVLGIRRGEVLYLTAKVASFEADDELKQVSVGPSRERFERPSVWVEMLDNSLREYGRIAKACVDAGIQERRIRLAENQGQVIDNLIRRIIEGIFAGLVAEGMRADELRRFERERLPAIVRSALMAIVPPEELAG